MNADEKLQDCFLDIKSWSSRNRLKLNESKTELLFISFQFRKHPQTQPLIDLGGERVTSSDSVRDLGVTLDKHLTLTNHIRNVCRSASWGIAKIGKITKFLNRPTTEKLVHAFVSSHIDYCNGLLAGLPRSCLAPLQRIQNTAARLITRTKKHEHITPILRSLHWLQVHDRVIFKVLLLTYKIVHNSAPSYLQHLVSLRTVPSSSTSRRLRSHSNAHLQLAPAPRTRTRYGDRAFSTIAPTLWNNLPIHVRQAPSIDAFKQLLKTHLFTQSL